MILIIGGAYQGKLDFVKDIFGVTEKEVFTCDTVEIDFSNRNRYQWQPDPGTGYVVNGCCYNNLP